MGWRWIQTATAPPTWRGVLDAPARDLTVVREKRKGVVGFHFRVGALSLSVSDDDYAARLALALGAEPPVAVDRSAIRQATRPLTWDQARVQIEHMAANSAQPVS